MLSEANAFIFINVKSNEMIDDYNILEGDHNTPLKTELTCFFGRSWPNFTKDQTIQICIIWRLDGFIVSCLSLKFYFLARK